MFPNPVDTIVANKEKDTTKFWSQKTSVSLQTVRSMIRVHILWLFDWQSIFENFVFFDSKITISPIWRLVIGRTVCTDTDIFWLHNLVGHF